MQLFLNSLNYAHDTFLIVLRHDPRLLDDIYIPRNEIRNLNFCVFGYS